MPLFLNTLPLIGLFIRSSCFDDFFVLCLVFMPTCMLS